jgi:hypothetical protein
MRITTKGLVLVLVGDAALLIGAVGLAGILQLSGSVGVSLIVVGIALNVFGVLEMIRAAREPNG